MNKVEQAIKVCKALVEYADSGHFIQITDGTRTTELDKIISDARKIIKPEPRFKWRQEGIGDYYYFEDKDGGYGHIIGPRMFGGELSFSASAADRHKLFKTLKQAQQWVETKVYNNLRIKP